MIYKKISDIMKEIEPIGKDKKNQMQGFKFRGIDDVYNALQKLLAKHEVFTVPAVLSERTEERTTQKGGVNIFRILQIKYTFYSSDGSYIEAVVQGEAFDSGDKASNKAMAIAHKYALLQTFCIPTESMEDPDSETAPPSIPKAKPDMSKFINSAKAQFNAGNIENWAKETCQKIEDQFGSKWGQFARFEIDRLCDTFKIDKIFKVVSVTVDENGEPE